MQVQHAQPPRIAKVLVWDLDNTLWDGTLAEGDDVQIRPMAREVIETLDQRGILLSVASKNDPSQALERLDQLGLADFFSIPRSAGPPSPKESRRLPRRSTSISTQSPSSTISRSNWTRWGIRIRK